MEIVRRASPNHEQRRNGRTPDMIVLHYTATVTGETALKWLCHRESKVSSHYLIECDGTIFQMVEERERAWHAGLAHWAGEHDINSCSIGIEIQNSGHDGDCPAYPDAQMRALEALCGEMVARYKVRPERVLGHSDVAPLRKIDPGEHFDWARLHRAGIGHWVEPVEMREGPLMQLGDEGAVVGALQTLLARYGYGIETTGLYDSETRMVVAAFQRHFRPERVDGVADPSTLETLDKLIAALPRR